MKKILSIMMITSLMFSSCIKEEVKHYTGVDFVEFDAAALNAVAAGVNFPILVRVPVYGFAAATANPSITRASSSIKFRVNLVGKQSTVDQVIKYRIATADYSAVLDVSSGTSQRLSASAGTHFNTTGIFTIPANTSFGEMEINVLNTGLPASTVARYLVLELEGNTNIQASSNYKRIGIQIAQTP